MGITKGHWWIINDVWGLQVRFIFS